MALGGKKRNFPVGVGTFTGNFPSIYSLATLSHPQWPSSFDGLIKVRENVIDELKLEWWLAGSVLCLTVK